MSDTEETPDAPVAAETAAPAPGEPMDVNSAVKLVLKKALAHDGLCRGLRETTRAIEKDTAQLCILAEDCDQPDYKKLVEALCAEKQVHLLSVPEAKQLGQWAGLCKIDQEGEARKVVGCSSVVVTVSTLDHHPIASDVCLSVQQAAVCFRITFPSSALF
ncbi:40S ribosomal protein S12 [Trebouxia sp. C0010 RCD-2024]